jgi:CBS domain-containing protein
LDYTGNKVRAGRSGSTKGGAAMKTIGQLLQGKGTGLCTVSSDTSLYDALKEMADKNIGSLLVVDNGKLSGILTERDFVRKMILQGKSSHETRVREIMTDRVVCVQPKNTVEECMALMTDKRTRHLPVIENDELIGVLSIGDLVKEMISEQQFMIKQLESYIHS